MSNNTVWEGDLLNRKNEGDYLVTYLINRHQSNKDSSFVLNINAEWGFGKTYFLNNLAKDLENRKYPVVYFDAWKNDFTDNPLLAFMSELNTSLDEYFSTAPKAKAFFKDAYQTSKSIILPILAKKLTGHALSELTELSGEEDSDDNQEDDGSEDLDVKDSISSIMSKVSEIALSEHKSTQQSIETFKKQMEKLLRHIDEKMEDKNLPMFILVDELDRCRPNYAIELLENIKHIFDISGIVFIVATDSQQLAHSINAIYGNNFSSERYLKRFFNQEYNLAKPDNYSYANYLFDNHNLLNSDNLFSPLDRSIYVQKNLLVELFCGYSKFFKLGLRDQEQTVIMLEAIVLVWTDEEIIHLGYLLFLIMLKQKSNEAFIKLNETPIDDRKSFITPAFLAKVDVDTTVYFKDYSYENGLSESKYNVHALTILYLDILNINYGNFKDYYLDREPSDKIYMKTVNTIREQFGGYPDINTLMTRSLNRYPELVLRAGQFS